MIFTQEESSKKLIAKLDNGDITQVYQCKPTICLNPICTCNEVFLTLEGPDEAHKLGFNIKDKTLLESKINPNSIEFATQVFESLDDADFNVLTNLYNYYKQASTLNADYSKLNIPFQKDKIERESTMVIYNLVLPYAGTYDITIAGKGYIIEDHYCAKSKCQCTQIALCFYPISNGETTDIELVDLEFAIQVDYQAKIWNIDPAAPPADHINTAQIRAAVETQYPAFYQQIRKRHQTIKLLYKNYLKSLSVEQTPKTGRNDPCPCGSGKKFKKCCGQSS
jgi:SEC-C motif